MIYIDPSIKVKSTIREGSVFYFAGDGFKEKIPHYYVVLNSNPLTDEVLLLVFASSFGEGLYLKINNSPYPAETFIDVTPEQCSLLKRVSIFDCNRVFEKNIEMVVEKLSNNKLKICGCIEIEVLKRLRNGVLLSPAVTENVKNIIKQCKKTNF